MRKIIQAGFAAGFQYRRDRPLANEGKVKRVNDSIFMSTASYEDMITKLKGLFGGKSEMTVAEFRDLLGTSRKYAMPLLEHLDAARVTLRTGDVRKFLLK